MKYFALAAALLAAVSQSGPVWTSSVVKQVAPGVTLTQDTQASPALLVDVLTVDPAAAGVSVAPAVSNDSLTDGTGDIRKGRETVSSLARREKLVAAVNGDFFPFTGDPLGLGVMDGEIYSEPFSSEAVPGRAAIGWLRDGQAIVGIPHLDASLRAADGSVFPITGIDRLTSATDPSDLVLSTARFGPTSASRGGGTEIVLSNASPLPVGPGSTVSATVTAVVTGDPSPVDIPAGGLVVSAPAGGALAASLAARFHVGDHVSLSVNLSDITPASIGAPHGSWNDVREAIGGGPILIKDGKIVVSDSADEGLGPAFVDTLHARTAVGVRADGDILIATVDGSSALSVGMSLSQLAALLQSLGAVDAINLDGGGSTTMAVDGQTVDFPSGSSFERPVADMLTVRGPLPSPAAGAAPQIVVPAGPIAPGSSVALGITQAGDTAAGPSEAPIWNGPVGDIGFVTQDGVLHALQAGRGIVSALVSGVQVSAPVVIESPGTSAPTPPAPTSPAPGLPAPPTVPPSSSAPAGSAPPNAAGGPQAGGNTSTGLL